LKIVLHVDPFTNTVLTLKYTNDLTKIKNLNSLLTVIKSFETSNSLIIGAALIKDNIFIFGEII
jgi:hypothetical protein